MNKTNNNTSLFTKISTACVATLLAVSANAADVKVGSTWQVTQLPNNPSLRGSALVDSKMWVSGSKGAVFVSEDMGKTWLNKSVSSAPTLDFRDIEVFNKNTAIIMSVGSGETSKLLKTEDGGDNWHLLYQNTDEQGFFDSIDFWNDKVGLLLGDPVDGYYVVKKTEDGGKTWRRISQSKLPSFNDKEAAFAASGNTLIVGNDGKAWIITGGYAASVYVSNDWGESWQRQAVPLYQKTQTAGGYGLAVNAKGELFALGGDFQQRPASYRNIARFDGVKWHAVDAGQRGLRTAMSCHQALCIATGKTGSDVSFDHGQHWQAFDNQKADIGDQGFYTIANEEQAFVAAGAEGKVGVFLVKHPE